MSFDILIHRFTLFAILALVLVFGAITVRTILRRYPRSSKLKIAPDGKANGIIFGKPFPFFRVYSPSNDEGHIIVLGGSGLGKTTSLLIPTLRSWKGAVFCIDISGDICLNIPGEKLVFDPFGANGTIPYNPFYLIDQLQSTEEQDAALERMANLLIPAEPGTVGDGNYFLNGARAILAACLIAGYHAGKDLPTICHTIVSTPYQDLFSLIDRSGSKQACTFINGFEGNNEKNVSGCYQKCSSAIGLFARNCHVREALRRPVPGEPSITPKDLDDKRVFVVIPIELLEQAAPLSLLITQQVIEYVHTRPLYSPVPLLMALDEFSSLGRLDLLPAFRTARKHRVRIMILTQSLADIDLAYGALTRRSIMENCLFRVILGAADHETQLYLAELVGKAETVRETTRFEGLFTPSRSYTTEQQYQISPQDFACLGDDLIVLHPAGFSLLKKAFFFKKKNGK